MKLVYYNYEEQKLEIQDEALAIKSFRDLYKRDRSKDKVRAMQELTFINFYSDPTSDFAYIEDDEERESIIKEELGFPQNWQIDDKIQAAIQTYRRLTETTGSLLLEDTRSAANRIRNFLNSVDMTKTDNSGKLVYNPAQIVAAIKAIPDLIKKFSDVYNEVIKEQKDNGRRKADKSKTIGDDGIGSFLKG